MADETQAAPPSSPTPPPSSSPSSTPSTTPLSIPDFASKIRQRDSRLTPDLVDDSTLVRKVLERRPDLTQYVQPSEARPQLRRGREDEAAAKAQIESVLNGRDPKDLSYRDRFRILSVVGKEFARKHAQEWGEAKDWREKLSSLLGTATGVAADVTSRVAAGATDPKSLAIGATGIVDPAIPAAYFFLEGAKRLPGEARKLVDDPSYENIVSTGLTATQVGGSAIGGVEGAGTGLGGAGLKKLAGKVGATKAVSTLSDTIAGSPGLAEKVVADAKKARASYDSHVTKINHDYANNVTAREKAMATAEADYVEEVATAREKWVQETTEAHHARKGAAMIEGHRQKLESVSKALTKVVDDNVKNTEKLEKADLGQQFDAVREQIKLEDKTDEHPAVYPQLNADHIKHRIDEARQMLQGAPEDVKAFNDLIKQMAKDKGEGAEESGGDKVDVSDPGTKLTLNWDEGRTQSSALGRASASESISGNVRKAIRHVLGDVTAKLVGGRLEKTYTGLEGELQRVADEKGAGKAYTNARMGWRQYMEDWHDMSSEKGGGSPLARLLRAADPAVVLDETKGKAGDRLIETLARHEKYGAVPKNLAKLRDYDMELSSLPKAEFVPEPTKMEKPAAPPTPAPVETPAASVSAAKSRGTLHEPPSPQQMMAQLKEAKAKRASDIGRKQLAVGRHDLVMGGLAAGYAFSSHNFLYGYIYLAARMGEAIAANSKAGQEWLSKVTDTDVEILNKAFANDPTGKAGAQQAVTNGLLEGARKGINPPLRTFGRFLNPAQMGKVLRAYQPIGQQQPELSIIPQPQQSPMGVTTQ